MNRLVVPAVGISEVILTFSATNIHLWPRRDVCVSAAVKEGADATTAQPRDGDPRPRAAGGALRDPVVARRCLPEEAIEERPSPPSSRRPWDMAPRWSRSPAEGGCR